MQTVDFVALATRVAAGVEGIRACLVLSRDGLTLAAHPADAESHAKEAWNRLQAVGDPQRGFLDLGHEIVALVRRGAYVGVAVAAPDVRPGLVIDVLEANLHAAEDERSRQTTSPPEPSPARAEAPRRRRPVRHAAASGRREDTELAPPAAAETASNEPTAASAEPATDASAPDASAPERVPAGGPERRVVDLSQQPSGGRWGARLRKLASAAPAVEEPEDAAPALEEAVAAPPPEPDEGGEAPEPAEKPRVDRSALARELGRLWSDAGPGD